LSFYNEARSAFQRSLEINSKFPFGWNNLGSIYFIQLNHRKAERYFKKAIHLKSDEPSFHVNLGSLYLEKKKPEKAMAEWRKALALDPEALTKSNAVSLTGAGRGSLKEKHYSLARIHASNGNVVAAIDSLNKACANGFSNIEDIEKEPDFYRIRNDQRFIEFLKSMPLLIKPQDKPESRS
jgi:tetratricopeptide (TPR) repeat protein